MNTESFLRLLGMGTGAAGLALMLAGCVSNPIFEEPGETRFGDANRHTMMAQVVNPDPQYEDVVPVSSGEHAAGAVERYRNDNVYEPETIRATSGVSGSGGS